MKNLALIIIIFMSLSCQRDNNKNEPTVIFEAPTWDIFTTDNSDLPHNFIRSTYFDSNDDLWIGTSGRGLFKQEDGEWVKQIEVKSTSIDGITEFDNSIWIATNGGGVYKKTDEVWENFNSSNSKILHNNIFDISIVNSEILIGSEAGMNSGDGMTWQVEFDSSIEPNLHPNVYSVLRDSKTTLWAGTFDGLGKFDGDWKFYNVNNSNIRSNVINDIYEAENGDIYFGTRWGVSRYSQGIDDFEDIFEIGSEKLYKAAVAIFESDDAKLWVATREAGFYVHSNGSTRHYTIDNSFLPSNNVYSVTESSGGDILLGTGRGLVRIPSEQAVDL